MNDLMWPPDLLGRLTVVQLVCLTNEKPPPSEPLARWPGRETAADGVSPR